MLFHFYKNPINRKQLTQLTAWFVHTLTDFIINFNLRWINLSFKTPEKSVMVAFYYRSAVDMQDIENQVQEEGVGEVELQIHEINKGELMQELDQLQMDDFNDFCKDIKE